MLGWAGFIEPEVAIPYQGGLRCGEGGEGSSEGIVLVDLSIATLRGNWRLKGLEVRVGVTWQSPSTPQDYAEK